MSRISPLFTPACAATPPGRTSWKTHLRPSKTLCTEKLALIALREVMGVFFDSSPSVFWDSSASIAVTALSNASPEEASITAFRCLFTIDCHAVSLNAGSKYFSATVFSILAKISERCSLFRSILWPFIGCRLHRRRSENSPNSRAKVLC